MKIYSWEAEYAETVVTDIPTWEPHMGIKNGLVRDWLAHHDLTPSKWRSEILAAGADMTVFQVTINSHEKVIMWFGRTPEGEANAELLRTVLNKLTH